MLLMEIFTFLRPHLIFHLLMTNAEQIPSVFSQADIPQQELILSL